MPISALRLWPGTIYSGGKRVYCALAYKRRLPKEGHPMTSHASRPARRRLNQFLAATVLLTLALTTTALPAAAATNPIHFGVSIGAVDGCITIWSTPDQTAHFTWRDSNGALKGQSDNFTDDGLSYFCLDGTAVEIADQLRVNDGSYTRTFIVPNLTINMDRVTDTYYGTGPAHRTVRIEVFHGDFGEAKSARVGDDGTWSLHVNQWSIVGGDTAGLSWVSPHDDRVRTYGIAPYVVVTLGRAGFSGYALPNQEVDVTLEDGNDAHGSATASNDGDFAGKFRDNAHNLRPAAAGDHMQAPSIASDADWILPDIDGTADASSDIVEGQCHNGSDGGITVRLYRGSQEVGFTYAGGNSDGSFRFNFRKVGTYFANPANVKHGDLLVVQCVHITGDIAQLKFIVD
jgi:hypothetical protein